MHLFLSLRKVKIKKKTLNKNKERPIGRSLFLFKVQVVMGRDYFNFFLTSTSWKASIISPSLTSL
jgi:hypothetical protein